MSFSPDHSDGAVPPEPFLEPTDQATTAGAQPVWARPAAEVQWVESEPLEYHELLRGAPRYRWWKPLVGLLLGTSYYFALSIAYSLLVGGVAALGMGMSVTSEEFSQLFIPDTQNPLSLVMALGSIALMIPAALLGMLSVGLNPAGRLWSVALRIRWRWIGRTILPALVALVVINGVGIFLDLAYSSFAGGPGENSASPEIELDMSAALWSVLFILLLVPLQSTAEELVFRGALMQAIGSWRNRIWLTILLAAGIPVGAGALFWFSGPEGLLDEGGRVLIVGAVLFAAAALMRRFTGSPFFVIALPSLLFALAHIYEIWGMLSVGFMALIAAWLVWRTGGLEAAISLHVVNNVVGFLFMVVAFGGQTGQTSEGGSPIGLFASVLGQVLFAWWVDRDFRRNDGRRTRVDLVHVPSVPSRRRIGEGTELA